MIYFRKIDTNTQNRGVKTFKRYNTHISVWSNARYSSIIPSENIIQSSSLSIDHKQGDLATEDALGPYEDEKCNFFPLMPNLGEGKNVIMYNIIQSVLTDTHSYKFQLKVPSPGNTFLGYSKP